MIIDDEPAARGNIRSILGSDCPGVEVMGEAGGVAEGLALLSRLTPDLLFLDVEMEDGTGFDLLDKLAPLRFNVIFTTAYDTFAIKAFRYSAIDYLLKPVDPDELAAAVRKSQEKGNFALLQRQIESLSAARNSGTFQRIVLPTGDGMAFAQTQDIVRIESFGNFSYVTLAAGERVLASRNLRDFEEMLPSPPFFRLHQSHIVNTAFVKKYFKEDGGQALMSDGTAVPISRRNKDRFLEMLKA